jgi:hypothetical protein
LPAIWREAAAKPGDCVVTGALRLPNLLPLRSRSQASQLLRPAGRIKNKPRPPQHLRQNQKTNRAATPSIPNVIMFVFVPFPPLPSVFSINTEW